jgi:membrane protease subunit HflK
MPTGDENIVDIHRFIRSVVRDPMKAVFHTRDPERALHASAEAAPRAAAGENSIDYTRTDGRAEVQERVKRELPSRLDQDRTGLLIAAVRLRGVDPSRGSARPPAMSSWPGGDRERLIKEAKGSREGVVSRARGEGAQMQQAVGVCRVQRLIRAQGDAARFLESARPQR